MVVILGFVPSDFDVLVYLAPRIANNMAADDLWWTYLLLHRSDVIPLDLPSVWSGISPIQQGACPSPSSQSLMISQWSWQSHFSLWNSRACSPVVLRSPHFKHTGQRILFSLELVPPTPECIESKHSPEGYIAYAAGADTPKLKWQYKMCVFQQWEGIEEQNGSIAKDFHLFAELLQINNTQWNTLSFRIKHAVYTASILGLDATIDRTALSVVFIIWHCCTKVSAKKLLHLVDVIK